MMEIKVEALAWTKLTSYNYKLEVKFCPYCKKTTP